MAGLSRAKAASIQILRTAELKASECKRPAITQFHARTARSQVAAQVAAPRPCASPVRLGWGRRLEPAHWALPPPPLLRGQQGASRDRLTSLGLRHVADAQDPLPLPRPLPPCRRKRSSSRSPTASSRRRRPTRAPSRPLPRRPSSARWMHLYVNSCASAGGEYYKTRKRFVNLSAVEGTN